MKNRWNENLKSLQFKYRNCELLGPLKPNIFASRKFQNLIKKKSTKLEADKKWINLNEKQFLAYIFIETFNEEKFHFKIQINKITNKRKKETRGILV